MSTFSRWRRQKKSRRISYLFPDCPPVTGWYLRRGRLPCCILVRTGGENCRYSLVDDGDSGVNFAFRDRKGWSHAEAVEHAAGGAHDIHGEAAPQAFIPDGDAQRVGWLSGIAILDQLDADEQSLAPDIADLLVAFLQFPQAREQVLSPLSCLLDQPLLLNHVDDSQPCRCGKRVGDMG